MLVHALGGHLIPSKPHRGQAGGGWRNARLLEGALWRALSRQVLQLCAPVLSSLLGCDVLREERLACVATHGASAAAGAHSCTLYRGACIIGLHHEKWTSRHLVAWQP